MRDYKEKEFKAITAYEDNPIESAEENKELTDAIKSALGDKVTEVKLTNRLKSHPVCITTKGELSMEMEKVLNQAPEANQGIKSQKVLEINANHPIYEKMQKYFTEDKEKLSKLSEVLFSQALLIEGMPIDDPTRIASLICELV